MALRSAKIQRARFARPPRGRAGRFVVAAKMRGEQHIPNFVGVVREQGFTLARKYARGTAEAYREELRERILSQRVPGMGGSARGKPRRFDQPLHPFTLQQKAASGKDPRTMIGDGEYINAIEVIEVRLAKGRYIYRVGFPEGAMHSSGLPLEAIGRIHEYGAFIKVTEKMRSYLHWKGLHLKATTTQIVIPARPHWQPVRMLMRRTLGQLTEWNRQELAKELKRRLRTARG